MMLLTLLLLVLLWALVAEVAWSLASRLQIETVAIPMILVGDVARMWWDKEHYLCECDLSVVEKSSRTTVVKQIVFPIRQPLGVQ